MEPLILYTIYDTKNKKYVDRYGRTLQTPRYFRSINEISRNLKSLSQHYDYVAKKFIDREVTDFVIREKVLLDRKEYTIVKDPASGEFTIDTTGI